MDSRKPSSILSSKGLAAIALTIALGAGWSAAAVGATNSDPDCDELARGLRSLDTPVQTLAANPVDHVTIDSGNRSLDAADLATEPVDSATPFLFLTPRVANVLRDIFGAHDQQYVPDANTDVPYAPVAEFEDVSESVDGSAPASNAKEGTDLPLLQRQMYRIDI